MDRGQKVSARARAYQRRFNGRSKQNGRKQSNEPAGVIPFEFSENECIEARYWENPVEGSSEVSIGYQKPRVFDGEKGYRTYHSYQLRHAYADIEATFRVCERALERHASGELALTDDDFKAADYVVLAFGPCFGEGALPQFPATNHAQQNRRFNGVN